MKNLKKITKEFNRIKGLGFIECSREKNKDGGIGNTLEDLLGVIENNKKEADFLGFEVKSKRMFNNSYISLFSKSPSNPKSANSLLREKYGEIRDPQHPEKKKLYASLFAHRDSTIYGKYLMKLQVDGINEKLFLKVKLLHSNEDLNENVYWTFEDLRKASNKMNDLMLVSAEHKKENKKLYYHFTESEIYLKFNFNKFIENLKLGNIMFDIRIGIYNSGKYKGRTHDHGSGFRIKKENFKNLYDEFGFVAKDGNYCDGNAIIE